jgi:hypothetical protein
VVRTFSVAKTTFNAGSIVRATLADGKVTVEGLTARTLEGKIPEEADRIGTVRFSENVNIIDTVGDGAAVSVDRETLKGLYLDGTKVRYYVLDADGRIEHLILRDVTGNVWSYGYVADILDLSTQQQVNVTYTLVQHGAAANLRTSGKRYAVKEGGVAVAMGPGGTVRAMQQLSSVRLSGVTSTAATGGSRTFRLADDVQIYLREGTALYPIAAAQLQSGYNLTGWYDQSSGQIRVVTAVKQ